MSEFHFLRPAWFLALLPALVLLVHWWRRRGPSAGWQRLVAPALLAHLLLDSGQAVRRLPVLLLGLGWLLAVTALAGPTWERQPQPVYRAPADRVIVLDMSPSMAAGDLQPDRLSRARLQIRRWLSEAQEGRTALVVFGAEPHVVAPLTDDTATIEALLPALSVDILPAPGDRAAAALRTAGALLQRVDSRQGEVLLVSDGISDPADSLEAIQELRSHGVRLSVLGVGTPDGAPWPQEAGGFATAADGTPRLARLDEPGLAALARAGGGRYRRVGDGQPLLPGQTVARDPAHARAQAAGLERWVEQGPWLLLPLLLIAAAGLRRGWLGVLVLLLVPPPPAQAFGWQDLWWRPDQQASQLLQQGEAQAAAERFRDPQWRATAAYEAGDYRAAAAGFGSEDPDSLYNRGNALARAGRLQEALEAYEDVLKRQPEHADARFNHDLVEKLLQQQEQSASGQENRKDATGQAGSGQNNPQGGTQQSGSGQDDSQGGTQQAGSGQDDSRGGMQQAAGQDDQQNGTPQADGAKEAPADSPPGKSAAGSATAQAANPTGENAPAPKQTAEAGSQQAAAAGEESREPAQDQQAAGAQDARAEPPARPADSAARARADVAPAAEQNAVQALPDRQPQDTGDGSRLAAAGTADGRETPSEQDLALEQWLHQVPDDPAGLLRRKFMVEHLLRRQRQTP